MAYKNKSNLKKPQNNSKRKTDIKNRKKSKNNKNIRLTIYAGIAVFTIILVLFLSRKNASEVFINAQSIGYIKKDILSVDDLINTVKAQIETEVGSKIEIKEEITLVPAQTKNELYTADYIISQIKKQISYKVESAVIAVDGSAVAILKNIGEAERLLKNIMAEYIPETSTIIEESSGFVENVQVTGEYVDSVIVMSYEEAYNKLTSGVKTQKPYRIVSGDALSKIAINNDMTLEELLSINPGLTVDSNLPIGGTINILAYTPMISVKTVENQVYTEKISKTVEYQYDNTKDSSYQKVLQQGKDGQREVIIQVTRINGFEESSKEISEVITVEPVKEIIVVGTN